MGQDTDDRPINLPAIVYSMPTHAQTMIRVFALHWLSVNHADHDEWSLAAGERALDWWDGMLCQLQHVINDEQTIAVMLLDKLIDIDEWKEIVKREYKPI